MEIFTLKTSIEINLKTQNGVTEKSSPAHCPNDTDNANGIFTGEKQESRH